MPSTYLESLFEVSDNAQVNNVIKGFYSSASVNMSQYSTLQVRKAFYRSSDSKYLNQLIFGNSLIYSEYYDSQAEALASLPYLIFKSVNGVPCSILVDWNSVSTGANVTINISSCTWIDTSNPVSNIRMAVEIMNRIVLSTSTNNSNGWPAVLNGRIHYSNLAITDKQVVNNVENRILDTASIVNQFASGVENIVIRDEEQGSLNIYETTNTNYGDINLVRQHVLNPYYEDINHRNSSFTDEPDGIRTLFYLSDNLCSETSIDIYKNGLRLALDRDYKVYPEHDLVEFTSAPLSSDIIVCDYTTKKEHFILDCSFQGDMGDSIEQLSDDGDYIKYKLTGVDSHLHENNNYNIERHGFIPMTFAIEKGINGEDYSISFDQISGSGDSEKYLHYTHGKPDSSVNYSRIENTFPSAIMANKIVSDVEVYIPANVGSGLNSMGTIEWLTLQEFFEGREQTLVGGGDYSGDSDEIERRLTLGMLKTSGINYLHFELWGQDVKMDTNPLQFSDYDKLISNVSVPFGEWFRLHTEVIPGDETHGRFYMYIVRANNTVTEVFNSNIRTVCRRQSRIGIEAWHDKVNDGYINYCYNLRETNRPVFDAFHTMKLYTSKDLVNALDNLPNPVSLNVYFRNLHLDCTRAVRD